jgi:hypothetical protein
MIENVSDLDGVGKVKGIVRQARKLILGLRSEVAYHIHFESQRQRRGGYSVEIASLRW